jgi:hypothetical protein
MCQEITTEKRRRGPLTPQTVGGRTLLTKRLAAARLGYSVGHLNRLLLQKKLKLNEYHLYPGAPSRLALDEIENLKRTK